MSNLIPINILIGDRTYRIKTSPEDEEIIRRTLKQINEKIIEFKTHFAGKDMQDYVAMVLIWYATQTGGDQKPEPDNRFLETLKKIEDQLDKAL